MSRPIPLWEQDADPTDGPGVSDEVTRHKGLWANVMLYGLRDAATAAKTKKDPYGASRWLWNDEVTGPGSFLWLCTLFDLEPERVRSAFMKNWRNYAPE